VNYATRRNGSARRSLYPGMTTTTLPELADRYLHANGMRLHVAEAGTSGPPVLLLHGYPQHAHAWRHVIADLAGNHRVYALDLRGAGHSDAPRRGYDTATLAGDVLAALDALGLRTVTLAGHEWGGWLGFHLALAAPERFTGFVAVNAPHPWLPHRKLLPQMWRFWYTALLEYPLIGAWVIRRTGVLPWLLRRGRPALPDADVAVFADPARQPAQARAGQQLHWQVVLRDIPRRVLGGYRHQHLSVPTLLLAGANDFALSPRSLTGAGHHADHLAIRIIGGAGHYLPEERPGIVAAAIREMASR
jgi:pimeloyl-ACP methyl ester carboxylesterase